MPPLFEGQQLDRATFHERYDAMPRGTRVERVGVLVYMLSPVGYEMGSATASYRIGWAITSGSRKGLAVPTTRRLSLAITANLNLTSNSESRKNLEGGVGLRRATL